MQGMLGFQTAMAALHKDPVSLRLGKPLDTLLGMRRQEGGGWFCPGVWVGQGGMSQRWYSTGYEIGTPRSFKSVIDSLLCVVFAAFRAASKILKLFPVLVVSQGR